MKLTLLAAVFLTLLSAIDYRAQRCGDDLWINVRDADSKIIQPGAFDSVKVSVNDQPETTLGEADLIEVPKGTKNFVIATGCGVRLAKISLKYKSKLMVLEVRNVAGDSGNIFLDSVPFREGTYTLDLKWWDRVGCEFDPAIEEPAAVRGGSKFCIIRPSKWKAAAAKQP